MTQPTHQPEWLAAFHEAELLWKNRYLSQSLAKLLALLEQYPHEFAVLNLTAVLLCENQRVAEGIAMWQRVDDWAKSSAIQSNIGSAYFHLKQWENAHQHFQAAYTLDTHNIDALMNDSIVLKKLQQTEASIGCLKRVLQLCPHHDEARFNLAEAYQTQEKFHQAIDLYEAILADTSQRQTSFTPKTHFSGETQLHTQLLDNHIAYTKAFPNLLFCQHYLTPYQPDKLAQTAQYYGKQITQSLLYPPSRQTEKQECDKKLHIGVISGNLSTHPVAYFLHSLLKSDAAQQFTWTAYANNATPELDDFGQKLRPAFADWHHITHWLDARVIEQIRADGVDILLDLSGLTNGHRLGVLAAQAAPVQVNWLGYFATTGLPTMQAVIADPYCVPPDEENWFCEKVWRMPHTRLCMSEPENACEIAPLPALKKGYLTLGTFQNLNKINDDILRLWAQIAQELPSAHWRIQSMSMQPESTVADDLRARLQRFGFNLDHVHLHQATSMSDYFAAHNQIDLILDTFPYTGGTTTCQSLYMGVPTITLTQAGMLARQGEQLLCAAGLADFVCHDAQEYSEKTLYWSNPSRWGMLNAIRLGLREQVRHSPLFDYQQFGTDWANLIRAIWRDACWREVG
ncbi:hypothetical protein MIS45_08140 [Wielerella bovis]|uniref:O-linked N-acetylglucosamine transferase, SPINDLY family protein n=1 Tax=Wielerella bovis TaxID=2917790 RepID=UPI002018ABDC|nr:hypothetical protein [Wielerella bovis]ULJ68749.1 hypothetical protein MIS45_08140 [Wielerella bovis]